MPDLLGKTVKAKPGNEIHAGTAIGKVVAWVEESGLYSVEWDKGPPWRGWYLAEELEVVDV